MPHKYKNLLRLKDIVDYYNKNYEISTNIFLQPKNWFKYLKAFFVKFFSKGPFVIPYLELVLTSKCTLKCRDCANLMQFYKEHQEYTPEFLIKSLESFLEAVDFISWLRLIGGEPLLYKDIDAILEYALNHKKVGSFQIVTNGTIIPKSNTLKLLSNKKASVFISDYGIVSKNIEQLKNTFSENNIRYILKSDLIWGDMGNFDCKKFSKAKLKNAYLNCEYTCKTLFEGEFFVCPRSAHGKKLKVIPIREEDYVKILELPIDERRKKLMDIYNIDYIITCNYCNLYNERPEIMAAIQME